jgi:hypothetical protein
MQLSPKLTFDFMQPSLDPRISFSRSGSTATRTNASGLLEVVAADVARFDFDPVSRAIRGLLVEAGKTNLILQSENFKATWINDNNTIHDNAGTAPNGSVVSQSLIPNATLATHRVRQTITAVNSPTASVYMESAGHTHGYVAIFWPDAGIYSTAIFNLITGSYAGYTGLQPSSTSIDPTGVAGVWRISTTYNQNINTFAIGSANNGTWASVSAGIPAFSGDNVNGIKIWGAALEANGLSSYIPSGATSGVRSPDVASVTSTNFSTWWRSGIGSALVRVRTGVASGIRPWLQFDNGTADNIISLRGNGTNPELYIKATTDQAQIDAGTIAANTKYRFAGAWGTNDCAAGLDSGTSVLDGVASIPVVTQARLGSDGTNYLNGHLESVEYYNERILNATLQVVSSTAGYQSIISPVILDTIIS